jgi:hypothetical protein
MQQNDKAQPSRLIIGLFGLFIAVTVLGLWWFQQANLKDFISKKDDARFYQPTAVEALLAPYIDQFPTPLANQQTLLHFWRPDCLCNRISQRHFSRLLTHFNAEQLRIIIIAHPSTSREKIDDLQQLNGERLTIIRAQDDLLSLPSSPSLALINTELKLGYFGAYGFGAFCTNDDEGFLTHIVDQMATDTPLNTFNNVIGKGCFCSW